MQELYSYLNLGQEAMVLMKSYGGIEVEKENWNVLCMVLSVRAQCMYCGSVQLIVVVELVFG